MTDIFGAPSIFGIKMVDIAIVVCFIMIVISLVRMAYRAYKERQTGDRKNES